MENIQNMCHISCQVMLPPMVHDTQFENLGLQPVLVAWLGEVSSTINMHKAEGQLWSFLLSVYTHFPVDRHQVFLLLLVLGIVLKFLIHFFFCVYRRTLLGIWERIQ